MKLYIWHDVYTDYTSGIAFAIASSEEEAIDMICQAWEREIPSLKKVPIEKRRESEKRELSKGTLEIRPLSSPYGDFVCGGG